MPLRTPKVDRCRPTPTPGSGCAGTRHGTYTAVREHGCTCPDALDDRYRYEKAQRTGRLEAAHVDACGTVRKLQALNALGYGGNFLAERLETVKSHVLHLMRGGKDTVHRNTAARVDEVYRDLSGTPAEWNDEYCPHLTEAERAWRIEKTKAAAQGRGYVSPMRWDGQAIDDPDAQPDGPGPQRTQSTAEEDTATVCALLDSGADVERLHRAYDGIPRHNRGAVVAALGDRGHTAGEIADLVGASTRQVERYLADHRRDERDTKDEDDRHDEEEEAAMTVRAGEDGGHVACEPCAEIVDIPPGEALDCPHSGDDDHAGEWGQEADVDDGPTWGDEDEEDDEDADAA